MNIPVTDLELYMRCPRAYKLHKLDGVETQYKPLSLCKAIAVRKVIATLHQQTPMLQGEALAKLCAETWQQEIADPKIDREELNSVVVQAKPATKNKSETPAVTKVQKSLEEVTTWCVRYAQSEQQAKVLYSNIYFEDTIGDITFTGYIDQIRQVTDGTIAVIDFKTGTQLPHPAFLARDFAMSLACHAVWQGALFPKYPDMSELVRLNVIPTAYFYYFPHLSLYQKKSGSHSKGDAKGDPLIPATRSQEVLLAMEYELLHTAAGIELQYFPMHVTHPGRCAICPVTYACTGAGEVTTTCDVPEYAETL